MGVRARTLLQCTHSIRIAGITHRVRLLHSSVASCFLAPCCASAVACPYVVRCRLPASCVYCCKMCVLVHVCRVWDTCCVDDGDTQARRLCLLLLDYCGIFQMPQLHLDFIYRAFLITLPSISLGNHSRPFCLCYMHERTIQCDWNLLAGKL